MKNWYKLSMIFVLAALVSCGENKEENEEIQLDDFESTEAPANSTPVEAAVDPIENVEQAEMAEVVIEANDQMRFSENEIRVKAGQKVKLTLQHVGEMGVDVMGHNWVLLKEGTDLAQFGQKAAAAKANDYIPAGTNQVIAHTKMLGGGESDTIEFEAPAPGTYMFICSFPGHYALMQGKFIVE